MVDGERCREGVRLVMRPFRCRPGLVTLRVVNDKFFGLEVCDKRVGIK